MADINKLLNMGAKRVQFTADSARVDLVTDAKNNRYAFSLDAAYKITTELAASEYVNPVVEIVESNAILVFARQKQSVTPRPQGT